jgi:glycosyltransferase involved in cell wall biosynthesis
MRAARPVESSDGESATDRLRVAFFAMFPEDNMATWTFCRWPSEHGREIGIEGRFCPPSGPGLHARMNADGIRFRSLRMAVYWYLLVFPRRLWQLWSTRRYDVALVQRGLLHPKSRPILERVLARWGPPVAYHLDDALWELKAREYRDRVRLARRLITGTDSVARFGRELGTEVSLVEYPVEVDRYPVREHREHAPVRIAWTGARAEHYLPTVLPGVLEACRLRGARLLVVGGRRRPRLGPLADRFLDWEPWDPDRRCTALAGADVGILPLEDSEWHRGKEPFKLKEFMAYGLPVVASSVGHVPKLVEDGREVFFARTATEWTGRLVELIDDPGLRARMGGKGRALVERDYRFEPQMARLVEVLRAVAASGSAGADVQNAQDARAST